MTTMNIPRLVRSAVLGAVLGAAAFGVRALEAQVQPGDGGDEPKCETPTYYALVVNGPGAALCAGAGSECRICPK